MSYTVPAGNAVNFSWIDALPYSPPNSPPNGDALNFAWALSSDPPDPPDEPTCTLQSLSVQSIDWTQDGDNLTIDLRLKGKLRS